MIACYSFLDFLAVQSLPVTSSQLENEDIKVRIVFIRRSICITINIIIVLVEIVLIKSNLLLYYLI